MVVLTRTTNFVTTSTQMQDNLKKKVVRTLQESVKKLSQTVHTVTTNYETIYVSQQYLTNEIQRIRNGEESSRIQYSRMWKLEFPRFSGDDHKKFVKIHGETVTWELYETEFHRRFGFCYEDPMKEIKNLKQSGIVPEYQDKFEGLRSRVKLNEQHDISIF
ncbi:reverse transcriptase [Tanacetum coccineum]